MEDIAVMFVADVLSKLPANLTTLRFLYLRGKYNQPLPAETLVLIHKQTWSSLDLPFDVIRRRVDVI